MGEKVAHLGHRELHAADLLRSRSFGNWELAADAVDDRVDMHREDRAGPPAGRTAQQAHPSAAGGLANRFGEEQRGELDDLLRLSRDPVWPDDFLQRVEQRTFAVQASEPVRHGLEQVWSRRRKRNQQQPSDDRGGSGKELSFAQQVA
ncbi:MAG: hypothetical protein U0527_03825 [Candidatus Eisenbacteria bacterium]